MSSNKQQELVLPEDIPDWLNIEYFNEILDRHIRDDYKIIKFSVFPANGKGENYAANLYRVNFVIKKNDDEKQIEKSFIIKAMPTDDFQEELMKEFNVFPKESEMYDQILPQFEQLFKEVTGEIIEFGPRCFKINKFPFPTDIIVLEDLLKRNYRMAERQQGLNMHQTKILLKKLAKFHATSAVYQEKNGDYNDCFNEGMYCEKMRSLFEKFFVVNYDVLMDTIRSWPFGKPYADKLCDVGFKLFDKMLEITKPDEHFLNVLNHGDLWTNNFLFKFDENNIADDILFVDYQMCFWGSPAIDLQYFITTSCSNDIKVKDHDLIVAYYHKYLNEYLKKLGYTKKIPTLIEFQMEMIRKSWYGTMTSFGVLSIVKLPPRKDASMEIMMLQTEEGDKFRYDLYNNPLYVEAMKDLLPYFNNIGAFDLV